MSRRLGFTAARLAVAFGLLATACGGSSPSSSSAGGSSSSSSSSSSSAASSSGVAKPGGSFCDQARSFVTELGQFAKQSQSNAPGATPNINVFKQLIGAATTAVDQLDGSAPSEIATALHTLRAAYDQANTNVQSSTTLQEMSTALQGIGAPAVKNAAAQFENYLTNTCGINPSATP